MTTKPTSDLDISLLEDLVLGDVSDMEGHGVEVSLTTTPVQFQPQLLISLHVRVRETSFVVKESVPLWSLPEDQGKAFSLFFGRIQNMARKLSFQLFELDPRTGMRFKEDFPNSPLFDPPYVTMSFREWNRHRLENELQTDAMTKSLMRCMICDRYFTDRELFEKQPPVIWCGGNLGFTHTHCAPWVTPW